MVGTNAPLEKIPGQSTNKAKAPPEGKAAAEPMGSHILGDILYGAGHSGGSPRLL